MAKYVVKRATLSFGSATYKIKSVLPAPEETCEAYDVTTLDDSSVQRMPGALTDKGDFEVRIAGVAVDANGVPAGLKPGTVAALGLSLTISGTGVTPTDSDVSVAAGNWIVQSAKPVEVEANNTRELVWDVTFVYSGATGTNSGATGTEA